MKTILFITAHSFDAHPVELDEEYYALLDIKKGRDYSDNYYLKPIPNPSIERFRKEILETKPYIVHFSGHGDAEGELFLSETFTVKPESLKNLLQSVKGIKCVFFNSCNSADLLDSIKGIVDYSIGIFGEIPPQNAIKFSTAFYEGLYEGEPIHVAFNRAFNMFDLYDTSGFYPVIKLKSRFMMEKIIFENQVQYLNQFHIELRPYIEDLRKVYSTGKDHEQDMFKQLMQKHDFALIVHWFVDKKTDLALALTKKVYAHKTDIERKYFAKDLLLLLDIVDSILVDRDSIKTLTLNYVHEILSQTTQRAYREYDIAMDLLQQEGEKHFVHLSYELDFFKQKILYVQNLMRGMETSSSIN